MLHFDTQIHDKYPIFVRKLINFEQRLAKEMKITNFALCKQWHHLSLTMITEN